MNDDLLRDLRRAFRLLGRTPAFTVIATLTLAAGIGASTATFSALRGILLRPLPVESQDELVTLWTEAPARGAVAGRSPDVDRFGDRDRSRNARHKVAGEPALQRHAKRSGDLSRCWS